MCHILPLLGYFGSPFFVKTMGKLKVAKKIPFLVSITYDLKEEIIEQVFSFQTTNKVCL